MFNAVLLQTLLGQKRLFHNIKSEKSTCLKYAAGKLISLRGKYNYGVCQTFVVVSILWLVDFHKAFIR
jgi:hypothetical protein